MDKKTSFAELFGNCEKLKQQEEKNSTSPLFQKQQKVRQEARIQAQNEAYEIDKREDKNSDLPNSPFAIMLGEKITPLAVKNNTSSDFRGNKNNKSLQIKIYDEDNTVTEKNHNSFANLIGNISKLENDNSTLFTAKDKLREKLKTRIQQKNHIAEQNSRDVKKMDYPSDFFEVFTSISDAIIRAMRAGKIHCQREFDLHGLLVDDAIKLINDAISERQNYQSEYWLIIHGKGNNSPDFDKAPIKNRIIDLLRKNNAVSAIASVLDSNRESGAVMVLIKSKNN